MAVLTYDPQTIANLELLFEPDESLLLATDWNYDTQEWVSTGNGFGFYRTIVHGATLALTQERMYYVQFRETFKSFFGAGGKKVANHWARHYGDFATHRFDKVKTNRGDLQAYTFTFAGSDIAPDGTLYTDPDQAERFMEVFNASVARFASVASTPDFAEQISAMHHLWRDGVLTEAEYQRSKELFIGKAPDAEQEAKRTLLSLKQLRDAGVLSEAEYSTKKWDVLSRR